MKKLSLLFFLFFSVLAFSQKQGSTYLNIAGGIEKNGYTFSASVDTHTGNNQFLRFGLEGQIERYSYDYVDDIPVFVGLFTSSYFTRIFSLDNEQDYTFFLGGGVLLGYEMINSDEDIFYQNVDFEKKNRFIYGLTAGGQFDIYLWGMNRNFDKGVSLVIAGGYNYFINSKVGTIQPYGKIGLKFSL